MTARGERVRRRLSRQDFLRYPLAGGALILVGTSFPGALCAPQAAGVESRRPFPQRVSYTAGTIKPNHRSQGELDEATRNFYDSWKGEYLERGCGPGRLFVNTSRRLTISFSEGHGYGMLITAFMAGHDPDARSLFDGLYRYFKDHQSVLTRNLMAYKQRDCESVDHADSATDGDMDIAYALLLADRQWGSGGEIDYRKQAVATINAIMAEEINPDTSLPKLGDWSTRSEPKLFFGTRSSDFMPQHWRAYRAATGNTRWHETVEATYALVARMQRKFSPNTGLLPDFIQATDMAPRPASSGFLEGPNDGRYSYNACRDPWRLATDYLLSGDPRSLTAVEKMNAWVRKKTSNDPPRIDDGYELKGENITGRIDTELEFIAPFGVGAMVHRRNQTWLNSIWDVVAGHPLNEETYYGNTLKLLAMITMSGNWWKP